MSSFTTWFNAKRASPRSCLVHLCRFPELPKYINNSLTHLHHPSIHPSSILFLSINHTFLKTALILCSSSSISFHRLLISKHIFHNSFVFSLLH
ncbi:hypothetical protein EYC84_008409 [Monilinia fructicola]|uniref:Uncharacterized protein n=1 Tax=Monilinia fructicola TaxID=38448 RepID=A0A5M9JJ16_MONFR|nr:hypothetical protein EYC84_008409 [Monilinia fructicola]